MILADPELAANAYNALKDNGNTDTFEEQLQQVHVNAVSQIRQQKIICSSLHHLHQLRSSYRR